MNDGDATIRAVRRRPVIPYTPFRIHANRCRFVADASDDFVCASIVLANLRQTCRYVRSFLSYCRPR